MGMGSRTCQRCCFRAVAAALLLRMCARGCCSALPFLARRHLLPPRWPCLWLQEGYYGTARFRRKPAAAAAGPSGAGPDTQQAFA